MKPSHETAFVGRSRELAALDDTLATVVADGARTLLVGGDAGAGKTRLLGEWLGRATAAGAHVMVGGCVEISDGGLPFTPVVEAVRGTVRALRDVDVRALRNHAPELTRLVPELGEPPPRPAVDPSPGISGRSRMFGALLRFLERLAADRPVVFVIEDAHWSDESTRDAIAFLARNLDAVPVLTVVTYRADELHRLHPLRPLVAELVRLPTVSSIEVGPLDRTAIQQLLVAQLDGPPTTSLVDDLFERSHGNPFAAEELVRAYRDGVTGLPHSLREVLLARVEALPAETLGVLRVVAAAGRSTTHELVAAVAALDEDGLAAAVRVAVEQGHLVVDTDDERYAFRHALLSEAVYSTLLPGERRRIHRRLAEVLASHADGDADRSAEIAYHWSAAGDARRALPAALTAAARAESVHAYREAHRQLERALDLWEQLDDPSACTTSSHRDLLRHAAELAYYAYQHGRAVTLCRAALAETDVRAEPVVAALLHERLGRYLWTTGMPVEEAEQSYARAVELLPPDPPTAESAQVLASHGQALMLACRFSAARERCQQALRIAEQVGALREEGHARNTLGFVVAGLGDPTGIAELERAVRIAEELDHPDDLARAYVNLNEAHFVLGHLGESIRVARAGRAVVRRLGVEYMYDPAIIAGLTQSLLAAGEWSEVPELVAAGRRADNFYSMRWLSLLAADLALHQGRTPLARTEFDTAVRHGVRDDPQIGGRAGMVAAALLVAEGAPPAAVIDAADEVARTVQERDDPMSALWAVHGTLAVLEPVDDPAVLAAADRLVAAAEAARRGAQADGPGSVVETWTSAVMLERDWLEGVQDVGRWQRLADRWHDLGFRPNEAAARTRLAESLLNRDDREAARDQLRRAHAVADTLGTSPLGTRIEVLAGRARLQLASEPGAAPTTLGLTARQLEVLRLVAEGRTNGQIAAALYISEKTASVHVSNILRRLEVTNRVEAAAIAHSYGLTRPPTRAPN